MHISLFKNMFIYIIYSSVHMSTPISLIRVYCIAQSTQYSVITYIRKISKEVQIDIDIDIYVWLLHFAL